MHKETSYSFSMLVALLLATFQPTVHVVWNDAYGLFPSIGTAALRREVETLFAGNGLTVRLHVARKGDTFEELIGPRVNVILSPAQGVQFGLAPNAMAAAIGERSKGYSIFVFYPSVRRTLGHDGTDTMPRSLHELSRGIGRIIAHELVHVFAPERGHARSGLMSRRLSREALLKASLELDAASRRLVLERVGVLAAYRPHGSGLAIPAIDASSVRR